MISQNKAKGFTIVELLIVIVVIGILAAISIVAYTGINSRAKTSNAQTTANQVANKAGAFNALEGSYPAVVADFADHDETKLEGNATVVVGASPAITEANGETTVHYVPCGTTGARIHYFDYTASPKALTTPAGTGTYKSITVGTC